MFESKVNIEFGGADDSSPYEKNRLPSVTEKKVSRYNINKDYYQSSGKNQYDLSGKSRITRRIDQRPERSLSKSRSAEKVYAYDRANYLSNNVSQNNEQGYDYLRLAHARSYSRSKSPKLTVKKIDIIDPKKRLSLESFIRDCIEDTKFIEKLKVDLSHRFDFTIPDLFDVVSGSSQSDTIDLHDMYRFLLMMGTTAPVPKPSGHPNKRLLYNYNKGPYPEPPITPDTTAYLISRIMAPIE